MSSPSPLPTSPPPPPPPLPPHTPPQTANPAELFTPDNCWAMKNAALEVPTPPYPESAPETPALLSYRPAAPESSPLASPLDNTLQTQMPDMRAASDIFLDNRFDISQEEFARSLANINADTQGSEDENGEQYDELELSHPPNACSSHLHPHTVLFPRAHQLLDRHGLPVTLLTQRGALFGNDDSNKPWVLEDEGWDQVDGG
ncbi:hypothetical protein B0H17DRAFT_1197515 [Mycena rosella]|uniref:Uncharacterized protein n=1 Tax=Mycena rosella TaxID=1033263 RepID=A0AAD7DTN6_MYCRO|nr:hypothetical protein B0H17DRAFT_1197515 [Mycena rosella]